MSIVNDFLTSAALVNIIRTNNQQHRSSSDYSGIPRRLRRVVSEYDCDDDEIAPRRMVSPSAEVEEDDDETGE